MRWAKVWLYNVYCIHTSPVMFLMRLHCFCTISCAVRTLHAFYQINLFIFFISTEHNCRNMIKYFTLGYILCQNVHELVNRQSICCTLLCFVVIHVHDNDKFKIFPWTKKNTNQQQFSLSSMTLNVSAATIHNEHFSFYEKSTCCAESVIFGSCHFHDAKNISENIKPQTKKIWSKHTQR